MENYYETLGLQNFCDDQVKIKQSYRAQIKFFHPDSKNVSPEVADEMTKQLNAAYEILSNISKKQEYDNQLRNELFGNKGESYSNSQDKEKGPTPNTHDYSSYTNDNSNNNKKADSADNKPEEPKPKKHHSATTIILCILLAITSYLAICNYYIGNNNYNAYLELQEKYKNYLKNGDARTYFTDFYASEIYIVNPNEYKGTITLNHDNSYVSYESSDGVICNFDEDWDGYNIGYTVTLNSNYSCGYIKLTNSYNDETFYIFLVNE